MISINVTATLTPFNVHNYPVKFENDKDVNLLRNIPFQVSIKLTRPAYFAKTLFIALSKWHGTFKARSICCVLAAHKKICIDKKETQKNIRNIVAIQHQMDAGCYLSIDAIKYIINDF